MNMVYIGIDVGGTSIKIGVVDEKGCILAQDATDTKVGRPFADIIHDMGTCALKVLAQSGYTLADVHSVGVGVPGIANQDTGNVLFCTNLHWQNVPLRAALQKYLAKPVWIDNDATVAGYAESICGVSEGTHSSVFMTLGTGVGGGIVINGKPWSGFHGVGSEIGHIPMDIDGVPCTCGNRGCLERYCSATAIIRMGRESLPTHPESGLYAACGGDASAINAKMVFDCAKNGDAVSLEIFHRYVKYMCLAIDTIICFLDPEIIILGGGVSKAGSFLLDAIRAELPRYLLLKELPYARIEIARLGADAGIIGAAMLGRANTEEA